MSSKYFSFSRNIFLEVEVVVGRIEDLCRKKGLSFRKVEQSLGFSNGILRSWEKKMPSADKLFAVASFFGVSMEYLLTGKETAPAKGPELSEDEVTLLAAFRTLTEEQRRFVLRQLRAAAQEPEDQAGV